MDNLSLLASFYTRFVDVFLYWLEASANENGYTLPVFELQNIHFILSSTSPLFRGDSYLPFLHPYLQRTLQGISFGPVSDKSELFLLTTGKSYFRRCLFKDALVLISDGWTRECNFAGVRRWRLDPGTTRDQPQRDG